MDVSEAHNTLFWMLDIYTGPMVGVAVRLGIPDLIASGPKTASELAALTDQHPGALGRMMRALSARGVFEELPDGRYGLTPLSELLRSGVAGSLRAMSLWRTTESSSLVAQAIGHSIKTGEPATVTAVGKPFFENLAARPEDLEIFTALMVSGTNPGVIGNRHALVAACGAFGDSRVVVDVAGGRGQLLAEVLKVQREARGLLFDRQEVVASAREFLAAAGVTDRVEVVAGDFFEAVPPGGDTYALSFIMHDWQDAQCLAILRNVQSAAAPGSRLLTIERVLPPAGASSPTFDHDTTQDINMMVGVGGMERTATEYRALFDGAGFEFVRDWPTGTSIHVLEGRRR